jgi:hypothetical protein
MDQPSGISARSRLLGRGLGPRLSPGFGLGHVQRSDFLFKLCGDEGGSGLSPVSGSEFEVTLARPMGENPDQVPEVQLGVEVVHPGRSDEGENVSSGFGVVIAASEKPGLAAGGDAPEFSLTVVVVELQASVLEKAHQGFAVSSDISERAAKCAQGRFYLFIFEIRPGEKGLDLGAEELIPMSFHLLWGKAFPFLVMLENASSPHESLAPISKHELALPIERVQGALRTTPAQSRDASRPSALAELFRQIEPQGASRAPLGASYARSVSTRGTSSWQTSSAMGSSARF